MGTTKIEQMTLVTDIMKLLADKHGATEVSARHINAVITAADGICAEFGRDDLKRNLVHARSSLADMERQRDEARAALKSYEEADTKPYTLGQTGSPVGDSPDPANAAGGGHVEGIQAPRSVAESQLDPGGAPASSPCLPQSSEDAPGWVCPFCGPVPGKQVTYVEEHENCGGNVYASDDSAPWFLRELAALRARAEKAEQERESETTARVKAELDRDAAEAVIAGAKEKVAEILSELECDEQETLIASLNEIGNGIQSRQDFYEEQSQKRDDLRLKLVDRTEELRAAIKNGADAAGDRNAALERATKAEQELARFQRADVGERAKAIEVRHQRTIDEKLQAFGRIDKMWSHEDRGELLSIVRQQAAEIERLTANMDRFRTDVGIEKAMHWGHRMRQERDEARAHLSAIGERVEKLKRWGCPEGRYMEPMHDGAYVALADVLSALEPAEQPSGNPGELAPEQPLEKVKELGAKEPESLRRGLPSRAVIDALAAINGWWRYTVDTSGPMAVQLRYLGEELQCDFGDGHGWRNQPLTAPYERTAWRPQDMTWAQLEALTNKAASEAKP